MERTKCYNAQRWECFANKNVKTISPGLVPSNDQTVSVILNMPENDPFNKPTNIHVFIVPELSADRIMELDYRFATEQNGELEYASRRLLEILI